MNILIVKLSSLGDVLHNLPIVWDIRQHYPHARVDWVVEEGYVSLLQPLLSRPGYAGLDRIIPMSMRRWKRSLFRLDTYAEMSAFRRDLQSVRYDMVIDTQGLIKSALVMRLASRNKKAVLAGLANATEGSGYEPLARWFYNRCVPVPTHCHAVERSRRVAYAAMGIAMPEQANLPRFYPADFMAQIESSQQLEPSEQLEPCEQFDPSSGTEQVPAYSLPYVLFFHATARAAKQWGEANWIAVGQALAEQGLRVVLPWGNQQEKITSQRLSAHIHGSIVPAAFGLKQAFGIIAGAEMTIGVDTGLTHLSAIMNVPTIELYCDSPRWKTEGYWSSSIRNLGDTDQPPTVDQVLDNIGSLRSLTALSNSSSA